MFFLLAITLVSFSFSLKVKTKFAVHPNGGGDGCIRMSHTFHPLAYMPERKITFRLWNFPLSLTNGPVYSVDAAGIVVAIDVDYAIDAAAYEKEEKMEIYRIRRQVINAMSEYYVLMVNIKPHQGIWSAMAWRRHTAARVPEWIWMPDSMVSGRGYTLKGCFNRQGPTIQSIVVDSETMYWKWEILLCRMCNVK